MTNFAVIFICLFAGILCKRSRHFPAQTAQVVNSFIIHLSFPALILSQFPKLLVTLDFNGAWWLPVSMAWITFVLSYLFFSFIGKKLGWNHAKIGALILTAGLGNTSFVGFPLLEALIGPHAIPVGILVDQPGSFLVLSTFGIAVAALYSGAKITPKYMARRISSFPPFVALVVSFVWFLVWGRTNPQSLDVITPAFDKISSTLVPLALFSVGFQLKFEVDIFKRRWLPLTMGLLFKLVFIPVFFLILYVKILGHTDFSTYVTVVEAAMASMITAAVVATEFNLDSEIANLMVGVSITLSLITVPLWNFLLSSTF
jgi:malate permease and related proteins